MPFFATSRRLYDCGRYFTALSKAVNIMGIVPVLSSIYLNQRKSAEVGTGVDDAAVTDGKAMDADLLEKTLRLRLTKTYKEMTRIFSVQPVCAAVYGYGMGVPLCACVCACV